MLNRNPYPKDDALTYCSYCFLTPKAALDSAKGMIRSEVGKQLGIKFTPTVEFVLDAIPEGAARMEELLLQAKLADEQVHQIAESANWAGEPDPYRQPEQRK